MPCTTPLQGYKTFGGAITFKLSEAMSVSKSGSPVKLDVPCGQCMHCRLEKARQWAVRMSLEEQLHDESIFLTLTYDNKHYPPNGGLVKSDVQNFVRRLKEKVAPKKIKYYFVGEYGDQTNRPHYHAIIYGYEPAANTIEQISNENGMPLYSSTELTKLWSKRKGTDPIGYAVYGHVNWDTCSYVARYVTKKINDSPEANTNVDNEARFKYRGNIQEFALSSRNPAIGKEWLDKYYDETVRDDYIVLNGKKMLPPKYFDDQIRKKDEEVYNKIKKNRKTNLIELTPERAVNMEKIEKSLKSIYQRNKV